MPLPAPTKTYTLSKGGTYPVGTMSVPAMAIPDNISIAQLNLDISSRSVGSGIAVTLGISYDGGKTWWNYTGALTPDDIVNSGSPYMGMTIQLQMTPGRLVQAQAVISGAPLVTTGVTLDTWV